MKKKIIASYIIIPIPMTVASSVSTAVAVAVVTTWENVNLLLLYGLAVLFSKIFNMENGLPRTLNIHFTLLISEKHSQFNFKPHTKIYIQITLLIFLPAINYKKLFEFNCAQTVCRLRAKVVRVAEKEKYSTSQFWNSFEKLCY